jgi:hypothetical protein
MWLRLPLLRRQVAMRFSRSVLAVIVVVSLVRCGGTVNGDPVPQDIDATCIPGSPGCPLPDGGVGDQVAEPQPEDGGTDDGSDGPSDAAPSDAAPDAPDADAAICALPDGSSYACDPLAQCGCGSGMACDLVKVNNSNIGKEGSVCRSAGITKAYEHCAQDEDCQPGFTCFLENCRRICATDSECDGTDPFRKCVHLKTVADKFGKSVQLAYGYCVAVCHPPFPTAKQNGDFTFVPCGPGLQCQPALPAQVEGASGLTWCINWSDKPRLGSGEPCNLYSECKPGFACEPPPADGGLGEPGSGERLCRWWCEVGSMCNDKPCVPVGISAGPVELGLCPV